MADPKCAQKAPYPVELEKKSYHWCACGESKKQPFCDGSHKGTEFTPMAFEPDEAKTYYLCGCKKSKNPPYCDGTHENI
jgi:CDGSH-type Zn-finger protein